MNECPVCHIPLGRYESCPSPSCPCVGTRCGSAEMEAAAAAWRSRPSIAAARTLTGQAALEVLERGAWLEQARAYGDVISIEIEHRARP